MAIIYTKKINKYNSLLIENFFQEFLDSFDFRTLKSKRILLKPNLLSRKHPEALVTTHPEIVRGIARALKKREAHLYLGDSPGGVNTKASFNRILKSTGMLTVMKEEKIEPVFFDEDTREVNLKGKLNARMTIARAAHSFDLIINIPKFKTHGFMGITCAVKNLFGFVPGVSKAQCHLRFREPFYFAEMLVDLACYITPQITFVDAIEAMDGEGPSSGKKFPAGFVAGSDNPFELDAFLAESASLDEKRLFTVLSSKARGLVNPSNRKILGDSLTIEGFELPKKTSTLSSLRSFRFISRLLTAYPEFNKEKCTKCYDCYRNCPPQVIGKDKDGYPYLKDLDGCIRCYCCAELCTYNAVALHYPWLLKVLSG